MNPSVAQLSLGRESYSRRAWLDAHRSLSEADRLAPLEAEDLELLATSAYMLGHGDAHLSTLERAYHRYLACGEPLRAARCALWLCVHRALQGDAARSRGWRGRAHRLVERAGDDCVERGYVLLLTAVRLRAGGDLEGACAAAAEAANVGERFGEADLVALALQEQGRVLFRLALVDEGLGLLDEAMVSVTAEELSPIVTGLVYCSAIEGCQEVHELGRAQEWTDALTEWCARQPDMIAFTLPCLAHRAEILQLRGAWRDALQEAGRAGERAAHAGSHAAIRGRGAPHYRQGDLHRLRGAFAAAEKAYKAASRYGWEPQPGLALLRLAQGNPEAAAAAIRRVVGETTEWARRAALLPAFAEIMLAVGDTEAARRACRELEQIAGTRRGGMLAALCAQARGAVILAEGDARAALRSLRHAWRGWQELEVPYEAARVRVLVGLACRALGDDDSAQWELDAARHVLAELGAAPDVARVDALTRGAAPAHAHGLTARELQVLRLLAAGESNKRIAGELVLSAKTVERHVSNIFAKLGICSRAAAAGYAYRHQLIPPNVGEPSRAAV